MRALVDAGRLRRLLQALGTAARGPGRIYLTGGATAVLEGWRPSTVDVDMKLEPEPAGIFEAIARLKDEHDVNIELASPDQFIPAVPGWQERSVPIATFGAVEFLHYDVYSQALAKLERGHARDLRDVNAMVERGLVAPERLSGFFAQIEGQLLRYPAIDAGAFSQAVSDFVEQQRGRRGGAP